MFENIYLPLGIKTLNQLCHLLWNSRTRRDQDEYCYKVYTFLLPDLYNYDSKAFPGILLSYRCKVKLKLVFIVIHNIQLNRNIDIDVNNVMYFNKLSNS